MQQQLDYSANGDTAVSAYSGTTTTVVSSPVPNGGGTPITESTSGALPPSGPAILPTYQPPVVSGPIPQLPPPPPPPSPCSRCSKRTAAAAPMPVSSPAGGGTAPAAAAGAPVGNAFTAWLTEQKLVKGVPNWVLLLLAVLVLRRS